MIESKQCDHIATTESKEFVVPSTTYERFSDFRWPIHDLSGFYAEQHHGGARESVAAHGLHRPTQERPAADSPSAEPTQRWCSDCGKGRVNVTGKSTRTVGLHPSGHLDRESTDGAHGRSGQTFNGHPAEPLVGQKFGHMTILEELPRRYSQRRVLCRCDCGTTKPARLYDLLHGRTVGCGCWKQQPRNRKERE